VCHPINQLLSALKFQFPPYLLPIDLCAADEDEAGVDDVLVDDEQQEIEAMEAILLPVTQKLAMTSTKRTITADGHFIHNMSTPNMHRVLL